MDLTAEVLGADVLVAATPNPWYKGWWTCWSSPLEPFYTTPEGASMSAVFQVKVRFRRMNPGVSRSRSCFGKAAPSIRTYVPLFSPTPFACNLL